MVKGPANALMLQKLCPAFDRVRMRNRTTKNWVPVKAAAGPPTGEVAEATTLCPSRPVRCAGRGCSSPVCSCRHLSIGVRDARSDGGCGRICICRTRAAGRGAKWGRKKLFSAPPDPAVATVYAETLAPVMPETSAKLAIAFPPFPPPPRPLLLAFPPLPPWALTNAY